MGDFFSAMLEGFLAVQNMVLYPDDKLEIYQTIRVAEPLFHL